MGEDDVEDDADTKRLAHTGKADELLLGTILGSNTGLLVELAKVIEVVNIVACCVQLSFSLCSWLQVRC